MLNEYIRKFMEAQGYEALTFNDVSMETIYADFLPGEAVTSTRFSRNISLNAPFISAAMDTVTEHAMAIEMAKLGGIGVIHKNLTPARQAEEAQRVKQYLHGLILHPVVFKKDMKVSEILRIKEENRYTFSGFPIVDDEGHLVGILTSRLYMPFIQMAYAAYDSALPLKVVSAPQDMVRLMVIIGLMIGICMAILGWLISRMKIAQVLKLGED